jgi:hypothetical protein
VDIIYRHPYAEATGFHEQFLYGPLKKTQKRARSVLANIVELPLLWAPHACVSEDFWGAFAAGHASGFDLKWFCPPVVVDLELAVKWAFGLGISVDSDSRGNSREVHLTPLIESTSLPVVPEESILEPLMTEVNSDVICAMSMMIRNSEPTKMIPCSVATIPMLHVNAEWQCIRTWRSCTLAVDFRHIRIPLILMLLQWFARYMLSLHLAKIHEQFCPRIPRRRAD